MKRKNLEKAVILSIILVGLNSCAWADTVENIDGNNSNGIVNLHGGEYGEIIGKGATAALIGTTENKINEGAKVSLVETKANTVFGGASFLGPAQDLVLKAESSNNVVEVNKSVIGEIYGGMATITDNTVGCESITKNNQLIIRSSTINEAVYGQMAVFYPSGLNIDNRAMVENGYLLLEESTVNGDLYGNVTAVNITAGDMFISSGTTVIENSEVLGDTYSAYAQSYVPIGESEIEILDNNLTVKGQSTLNNIYGACVYLEENQGFNNIELNGNKINLEGGTVKGNLYLAYVAGDKDDVDVNIINNSVIVKKDVDLTESNIYGFYTCNENGTEYAVEGTFGNDLIIDGWKGQVNSINNFNNIKFQNIEWQNQGVVVEVLNKDTTTSLEDTKINLQGSTTLAGGTSLKSDDYMYFIKTDNGSMGTKDENVLAGKDGDSDNIFTAGVAFKGTGKVEVEENGNVKYTITNVENTEQAEIVPVNSSLAAAFVINGSDLVVDGLNAMEQDQLFGVKTFAIVEGHDSTYDVADDLKVNGWNGLYGVGNIKEYDDGNLSYAAFFENGTANYRTFNNFMNEVIRGDGSIVYNGGGIAGRYKKNNGFYTEASLRAGLLKNELKNMFKDGNSNIYGYKTESPYYAFHLGTGRIIDVESDKDLDLYVRYYHTYNDGDDFTVAGDRFEVDSITSDKIRVGTRYNVNNNEDVSTYYGLAWEYEFNGDADVKVNDQSLPGESLKGSSGFAEIGFVQKNSSPWSLEGRVRGYVGEREGISGLLRATYSF